MSIAVSRAWRAVVAMVACGLLLTACSHHKAASPSTTASTTTAPTTSSTSRPSGGGRAPNLVEATYTDSPAGQPGYALVVAPGPTGSGTLGGVAVYQYQDGKEAGYFSFRGRVDSLAPFTLTIKGDHGADSAVAQVSTALTITIKDCARLFSPAIANGAAGEAEPPAPPSCTFSYKLAPYAPPPQPQVATDLTATAAIKSGLLNTYLVQNGWQAQYGSDITLDPGTTYVAYDPQTGLNWAYASFGYHGPATESSGSPAVAMQDGGDTGFFYQIPDPAALPSADDGWVMVGSAGEPRCLARSVLPTPVITVWGLVDPPGCSAQN